VLYVSRGGAGLSHKKPCFPFRALSKQEKRKSRQADSETPHPEQIAVSRIIKSHKAIYKRKIKK
jgi:hypothetical protein